MYFKCFLLFALGVFVTAHKDTFIIGGRDELIENVPWQISLQFKGSHICGGSIYDADIIITAAHCLENTTPEDLQIRVGSSKHNEGGTLIQVAATLSHENYNNDIQFESDIAVLRLSTPLTFSKSVQPIMLATDSPDPGTEATVTGWGYTRFTKPTTLRSVELAILSESSCRKIYLGKQSEDMICAYDLFKGACYADSGGPLVINRELVGVVSFRYQFCLGPTVFANVPVLRKWIIDAVERISKQ